MRIKEAAHNCTSELERILERQVDLRTWGRIHRLHVERTGSRVVVHGYTSSYYVKQLALQAVLEVLGSANLGPVDLDIQVGGSAPGMGERNEHRASA